MKVQKEQMAEIRSEMISIYRTAYARNPGLEQFNRRKKGLLWGFLDIVVLQRLNEENNSYFTDNCTGYRCSKP